MNGSSQQQQSHPVKHLMVRNFQYWFKSKAAGATVNEVIADTAYSTLENLKDAQSNDYKLISKLNPSIIKGTRSEDGFIFNKDADTMQCQRGIWL